MIDRVRLADMNALHTLGANSAVEAPARLSYGLFLRKSQFDLIETACPLGRVELRHPLSGPYLKLPFRHARPSLFGLLSPLPQIHPT